MDGGFALGGNAVVEKRGGIDCFEVGFCSEGNRLGIAWRLVSFRAL